MAKLDLSEKFKGLKDKVNTTEVSAPMQKVVPVSPRKVKAKTIDPENADVFTFWSTKELLLKVKMRALQDGVSAKEVINKALDMYLNT
jgi:hypothetical protein